MRDNEKHELPILKKKKEKDVLKEGYLGWKISAIGLVQY